MLCYNCFREKSIYGPCPICGYDPSGDAEKYPLALKPGSILNGRYIVGRVLGQGGFGITYIVQDYNSKARFAIKEYFPTDFVGRVQGSSFVQLYSGNRKEYFEYGKEQFLQEAKTLATFIGDEHIVRIYSYFEENNTAYFVMEYVDGSGLDKYMQQKGGPLNFDESCELLLPVMKSLEKVHAKGIVHRDIAPDNIIVTKDGTAKLIDFGAARYSTGEKSKSLDVILKHGFAPKEQYTQHGRQGPYTDVYAFAATWYYTITGKVPPEAIDRTEEDKLIPPTMLGIALPAKAEETLLRAMEVKAQNRHQAMADFYEAMEEATRWEREQSERKAQKEAERQERDRKAFKARVKEEQRKKEREEQEARKEVDRQKNGRLIAEWKNRIRDVWRTKSKILVAIVAVLLVIIIAVGYLVLFDSDITEKLAKEKALRGVQVSDIICFGSYEQDNDLENGKEDIEWIVLEKEKDRILVISKYGLDRCRYNTSYNPVAWKTCSLRKWLNESFLNEAFSTEEQASIPMVNVTEDQNPEYHHNSQSNDTTDKVFLLSIPEAKNYFLSDGERQCTPTEYAKAQGVYADAGNGNCWFWLRSPVGISYAAVVDCVGSVDTYGDYVLTGNIAVRPALWIDISGHSDLPFESAEEKPETVDKSVLGDIQTVGSVVTFGHYEQDNDLTNGKEPIEWFVLDVKFGKSLLISKYGLNIQRYNNTNDLVTWETCTLRKWLNEGFLYEAFSTEEQARIPMVTVTADQNPEYSTASGDDTQDKVFLLSIQEAEKYFSSDEERQCKATAYAKSEGCMVTTNDNCWWWLRSPGRNPVFASGVNSGGSVRMLGSTVNRDDYVVRPAIWINWK